MIKCIIVDDEPLAGQLLASYAEKVEHLEVLQVFHNPLEALSYLQNHEVDLIFLDVQMPELKGTQFAKIVSGKTGVIFTTAYPEHAVEGFELNAVDYLVKPINFQRFLTATTRYTKTQENVPIQQLDQKQNLIFVKTEHRLQKIKLSDIQYLKSLGDYVQVISATEKTMTLENMKSFEERLPSSNFLRVHRSYLIALDKINFVQNHKIKIMDEMIPLGKTYQEAFYNKLKEL